MLSSSRVNNPVKIKPHQKIWPKKKKNEGFDARVSDLVSRRNSLCEVEDSALEKFSQFPLSDLTLKGLKNSSFIKPTVVQRKSLKHSLAGKDIVVEAKTGSGKTLAFVIPILECIYSEKITDFDGPVAIILTPTRELARQIYTVFQHVGKFLKFTMLDIMGGKTRTDKRDEWQRIAKANVLIGTPGRFAQQQQENPTLDMSNLRILVLDEADRLLDPTFLHDLLIITDNLNTDRQSLLFSATLSKTKEQLSCLNLKSPVMISTQTGATTTATPTNLIQSYSVVPLGGKLDYLWTFLQSHCKKKIIVFFSTQKQVRYVHDLFLQLRPFFSVMQLRGNMLQSKRFKIYERFSQTPRGAVLFATNVAERGLDFPAVDWVVQFDCPKQLNDYIHRVGRTARAEQIGRAITFLLPSEVKLIDLLADRNIVLRQQQFPESRIKPFVSSRAPILLVSQPELAASARSAFTAYLRDYCFTPKQQQQPLAGAKKPNSLGAVFLPDQLPIPEFASSLGLPTTPELPKMFQQCIKQKPTASLQTSKSDFSRSAKELDAVEDTERSNAGEVNSLWPGDSSDEDNEEGLLKRKTFSVMNPDLTEKAQSKGLKLLDVVESSSEGEEDEEDDADDDDKQEAIDPAQFEKKSSLNRVQLAKRELKKNIHSHSKIDFDDSGNPLARSVGGVPVTDLLGEVPSTSLNIEAEREKLRTYIDAEDKARWQERIRMKHRLERLKAKESRKQELADRGGVPPTIDEEDGERSEGEEEEDETNNDEPMSDQEEDDDDTEDDGGKEDSDSVEQVAKRQRKE